ncbi:hypothetical protein AN189_17635 [Loktanella sp. 3ANDIMAR09]|uniref:hypothetical protein n=1 Tax=Loktanella sp. 3ANDIMAR09 TaxID=1225657 RepID=UPI0006FBFFE3|nr:hypothetical protein [Loktanella sp. 3ANDIMAR09]KQI67045.1 hypothetical protein AN189_17635 [Loktanella sp. 3ANDIMAR09]
MKRKAPAKPMRAEIVTLATSYGSTPGMLIDGDAPTKGDKFSATLANGITYSGTVAGTEERDGKTLVMFRDGIEAVK